MMTPAGGRCRSRSRCSLPHMSVLCVCLVCLPYMPALCVTDGSVEHQQLWESGAADVWVRPRPARGLWRGLHYQGRQCAVLRHVVQPADGALHQLVRRHAADLSSHHHAQPRGDARHTHTEGVLGRRRYPIADCVRSQRQLHLHRARDTETPGSVELLEPRAASGKLTDCIPRKGLGKSTLVAGSVPRRSAFP